MTTVPELFSLAVDDETTLTLMTDADAPAFLAFVERNRASLERWLGWPDRIRDEAGAREFIDRYARRWERQAALLVNIACGKSLAGMAVYRTIDGSNRRAEIGYALDEDFRGRGLATRVTRALIDYAFDALDLHRVVIVCASGNLPSRAIPERLGFQHEGTSREASYLRGSFIDLEHYGLLRREWQTVSDDRKSAP